MPRSFVEELEASRPRLRALVRARLGGASEVDDVVQQIVIRAWRGREGLRDAQAFPAWLTRIATNEITDTLRHRSRRAEVPLTEEHDVAEHDAAVAGPARQEMSSCLQELAGELPAAQRDVVVLHHGHELSHVEVADELGCSVSAAKVRAFRGRTRLAALVDERCRLDADDRGVLVCEPLPPT